MYSKRDILRCYQINVDYLRRKWLGVKPLMIPDQCIILRYVMKEIGCEI